jgi:large subunit ribosomal protein L29
MKMKDIQGLSQEELLNQLSSFKKDLADMQRKHRISPMDNPMVIQSTRKIVARCPQKSLTVKVNNRGRWKINATSAKSELV